MVLFSQCKQLGTSVILRYKNLSNLRSVCVLSYDYNQKEKRPPGVREVMGSIPDGDSLSHTRVMLISSLFTFHYRA